VSGKLTYHPLQNPDNEDTGFWGKMFETYGEDERYVMLEDKKHVWTLVDHNPNSVYLDLIPGYHLVDRLGYFISDVPWEDEELVVTNDPS
jgi:hypothetical protein